MSFLRAGFLSVLAVTATVVDPGTARAQASPADAWIPVNAWVHDPVLSSVALSPDGRHLVAVSLLHLDRDGQLWVGTNNGLARRLPNGGFTVMNTHDGLFSNAVFSMDTAPDGTMWVGGYGGVARIRPDSAGGRPATK